MQRLAAAALLAFLPACSLFFAPPRPAPRAHTCYRTTGALLSPAPAANAQWLMLTDSGGSGAGARWYDGRVETGRGKLQPVRWQRSGAGGLRVRWGNDRGSMEAAEQRGVLSGTARSGAQRWAVSARREDCPRDVRSREML